MGYFKDAVKGFGWMGALRAFMVGIGILKIAVLARILTPEQFGVYGFALLILGLLEVLTETGINIFLIQEDQDTEKYLNSAWVTSILRGILISLLILSFAPFVSRFFNSPQVIPLLQLTALVAFARGFVNPMVISFQKNLQFAKEFIFKGGLYLIDGAFAVSLAFVTKSPSAIILGMLVGVVTEIVISFLIFKRPKLEFDKEKLLKVINRGKWITGAGTFNYLFTNIDNIVVGKLLGAAPLGLYQQAYKISTFPVTQVGEVFNKVTFPVYVKIEGDRTRLKKAFVKTSRVIFALVVPFSLIIFFFSRPLILFFLGEKWLAAEPALKVLALFGALKSLVNSTYSLFLSLKEQNIVMFSELSGIIGISVAIIPLVNKFGLIGAGYATIIGVLASTPVILFNLDKIFKDEKN